MKFKPKIAMKMASPGKVDSHQAVNKYRRPTPISAPHSGVGAWAPNPMKLNPAVVTKVSDRGTGQAVGVVADVGMFLDLLAKALA